MEDFLGKQKCYIINKVGSSDFDFEWHNTCSNIMEFYTENSLHFDIIICFAGLQNNCTCIQNNQYT